MSNEKTIEDVKPINDNRVFIGIDPGKSGGFGVIKVDDGIESSFAHKFPKELADLPSILMSHIPNNLTLEDVHVSIEHVHAFPNQGSVSTFSFGQNLGQWEGVLASLELEAKYISPRVWMAEFIKLGLEKKDRKRQLYAKAQELFPNIKITFNISDALLLTQYAYDQYYQQLTEGVLDA
tara:strand:+ start:1936 stop:2472 length:537 start_codon:yes stop_codon:yes gene_type:complete